MLYSKQKDRKLQTQTGLVIPPGLKLTNAGSYRSLVVWKRISYQTHVALGFLEPVNKVINKEHRWGAHKGIYIYWMLLKTLGRHKFVLTEPWKEGRANRGFRVWSWFLHKSMGCGHSLASKHSHMNTLAYTTAFTHSLTQKHWRFIIQQVSQKPCEDRIRRVCE